MLYEFISTLLGIRIWKSAKYEENVAKEKERMVIKHWFNVVTQSSVHVHFDMAELKKMNSNWYIEITSQRKFLLDYIKLYSISFDQKNFDTKLFVLMQFYNYNVSKLSISFKKLQFVSLSIFLWNNFFSFLFYIYLRHCMLLLFLTCSFI